MFNYCFYRKNIRKIKMSLKKPELRVSHTLQVTIYNIVIVCIFGYGIVEKGISDWHWFSYVALSFTHLLFLGAAKRWENITKDSDT